MAEVTENPSPDCNLRTKAGSKSCKLESTPVSICSSPLNLTQQLIYVRYQDHVLYNRSVAETMKPQIREAVGWQVYDCDRYIILSWDRDAQPPTLTGGDQKASGLVLLKSDILLLTALSSEYQRNSELNLKSKQHKQSSEFAFRPSERKTHGDKHSRKETL